MMEKKHNNSKNTKEKVLLGLSGGVDSTTAALLLKEKGYEVAGYYFDVTGAGAGQKGLEEAKAVAFDLGIDFFHEDVSSQFRDMVIENFCNEYMQGRTPNPCVLCNPAIKFKHLLAKADEIGAGYVATGHYSRIAYDQEDKLYYIRQAANQAKDQSYMLYRLGQEALSRLILPLGDFQDKEETRDIARKNNLKNAEKRDSQEICFIEDDDYAKYLADLGYVTSPGDFVDKAGKVLGQHKGISNYTRGQRKGLGIALGKPAYVVSIDKVKNQVVLGENDDLMDQEVACTDYVFAGGPDRASSYDGKEVLAKIRYSSTASPARLKVTGDRVIATFLEPQRAAAPGQSMVFYDGDRVVGGGYIV